jgi:hypothetical protein
MITGYAGFTNPAVSAVIANGQTASGAISTGGMGLVGIYIPAAFTGTTITFQGSTAVAGTFVPVYNSSGQVSYTVSTSRYIAINPADIVGIPFLKIVSGSSEGAARTLTCSFKG